MDLKCCRAKNKVLIKKSWCKIRMTEASTYKGLLGIDAGLELKWR
jgi:hypothetical protein